MLADDAQQAWVVIGVTKNEGHVQGLKRQFHAEIRAGEG